MTVKEIVEAYLKENGFDGLAGFDCGCNFDDLMDCAFNCDHCEPGYLHPGDEDYDYYIRTHKPEQPATPEKDNGPGDPFDQTWEPGSCRNCRQSRLCAVYKESE